MKLNLTFALILFIAYNSISQRNIYITYDYAKDQYKVLIDENDKHEQKSTNSTDLKEVKSVKLKEGDVVRVKVNNYNPLKYKICIEQRKITYQPLLESQAVTSLVKVWERTTGIQNIIGSSGLNLENAFARDAEEWNIQFAEEAAMVLEYNEELMVFEQEISTVTESINQFSAFATNDLKKETLDKESALSFLRTLRDELRKKSLGDVIEQGKKAKRLYQSAKVYPSDEAFLRLNNLSEGSKDLEEKVASFASLGSSFQQLNNCLRDLEEIQNNPLTRVDVETIETLIQTIEEQDFVTERTFTVQGGNQVGTGATDPEGILTDLNFEVLIYDVEKLTDLSTAEEEIIQYVKYPSDSMFIQSDGTISSKPCLTCPSLIRAEGAIKGTQIPTIDEVINGPCISCIGKWIIYNELGEIERIKSQPKATVISGGENGRSKQIVIENPEEFETAVKLKKSLTFPVSGAIAMNWTTGIFAVAPFSGRKSYDVLSDGDSIHIEETSLSPLSMTFGTMMSIDFLANKHIVPSLNLGVAVDIIRTSSLNYLLGFSVRPKKLPLFSLAAGLSYSPAAELNNNLQLETNYAATDYYDLLNDDSLTKEIYRLGYFLGLCINF